MSTSTALARRLVQYIDSRPAGLRTALNQYAGSSLRRFAAGSPTALPLWLIAPRWYARRRATIGRRFLPDVLFGQYCLFLAIRVHDDLLDDQAGTRWLIPAGDDLLIEAEHQFARHVDSRDFWSLYRRLVRETLHGIAEVDRLQRSPAGMRIAALPLYAKVASIFNVGVAATCSVSNQARAYRQFARYAHHLAICGQLQDDLEDVDEDARRGRMNAAVTMLLKGRRLEAGSAAWRRALAAAALLEGRAAMICELAREHADRAVRIARLMGIDPAIRYAEDVSNRCAAAGTDLHRARVRRLLPFVNRCV